MKKIRWTRPLLWLLLCLTGTVGAQNSPPPSAAERLVFDERQLRNVKPPLTLRYRYVRSGDAPAEDDARIELRAKHGGGCCIAEGHFLSGERALALPTLEEASANPVILYFLEYDVREMQRLTRGQHAHFRRRIRLALADEAEVKDVSVQHAGRALPAREVRVRPYLADPSRNRFERYAGKEYVFVLADGVPGGVYQMRTRVPGAAEGAAPLVEESLTLVEP